MPGIPPTAGEQSEEWLTGKQYLDMSLLDRVDQEQEAEPRLNPAECGREEAAASTLFTEFLGLDRLSQRVVNQYVDLIPLDA